MNLKSNWWLLIGTVLCQAWLPSATSKKGITSNQRPKKEVRSAEYVRVKKVSLRVTVSILVIIHRKGGLTKKGNPNQSCFDLLRLACVGYLATSSTKLATGTSNYLKSHLEGVVKIITERDYWEIKLRAPDLCLIIYVYVIFKQSKKKTNVKKKDKQLLYLLLFKVITL